MGTGFVLWIDAVKLWYHSRDGYAGFSNVLHVSRMLSTCCWVYNVMFSVCVGVI